MRVFGLDPVADPVGRPVAHRLSLRGERPARLDARRRADSLLARVLSGLGRCVRGGAAAGVRARPGGEDQDPLQGAEGARRTADRAGLSSRAAGAGRAVVRPRSDRPPRHSRRRHSHHRRRRPHGAVFVALAGGSGAGRRSRHDDPPGHDRAERAAGRHQGARTAAASLDEIFVSLVGARIPRCDRPLPPSPGNLRPRIAGTDGALAVYLLVLGLHQAPHLGPDAHARSWATATPPSPWCRSR